MLEIEKLKKIKINKKIICISKNSLAEISRSKNYDLFKFKF